MILAIEGLLRPDEVGQALNLIAAARLRPGAETAGWNARAVKNNLQMAPDDPAYGAITALVHEALARDPIFQAVCLPRRITPFLVSVSEAGMGYGRHVDNALMGERAIRTDIAFTLFLSAPEAYEGGDLIIEEAGSEDVYKLPAGAIILYPATSLHRVANVTQGRRQVVVGWVESLVRDSRIRALLFDLSRARDMIFEQEGKSPTFDLVMKSHANLLRLHAET